MQINVKGLDGLNRMEWNKNTLRRCCLMQEKESTEEREGITYAIG